MTTSAFLGTNPATRRNYFRFARDSGVIHFKPMIPAKRSLLTGTRLICRRYKIRPIIDFTLASLDGRAHIGIVSIQMPWERLRASFMGLDFGG
jgi:hypothetical protein